MRRAIHTMIILMLILGLAGCVTTQGTGTTGVGTATIASQAYAQAQQTYLNAFNSYHTVWSVLPETDPRKAEWTQKYHPQFVLAAQALLTWSGDPTNGTNANSANAAIDQLTVILLQLAIPLKK